MLSLARREAPTTARSPPSTELRSAVRDLLLSTASFHALPEVERRQVAQALVRLCDAATTLAREEAAMDAHIATSARTAPAARLPLARAQANAGQAFSGVSAARVAGTTRQILNAVSFPRFVTELINGVFKAILESNQQQMHAYVDLIQNVASATDGFADENLGAPQARQWLAERYPGSFTLDSGGDDGSGNGSDGPQLQMRDGGAMPPESVLRIDLGLSEGETIPSGDPESSLVPFARRALARQRQQMLSTMVMLGMQRIVIESGRLNAAMRFHIDTRSAATADEGSRFDLENRVEASGGFKVGPWGIEAKMTNTIGYVTTQRTQTTEEMNTDLDLNSSVELYFKTDYLPLERLAGPGQVDRIKANTINPEAEMRAASDERAKRLAAETAQETARAGELDRQLQPRAPTSSPAVPSAVQVPAATPAPAAAPAGPRTPQQAGPAR